jgi:hypothetical protein
MPPAAIARKLQAALSTAPSLPSGSQATRAPHRQVVADLVRHLFGAATAVIMSPRTLLLGLPPDLHPVSEIERMYRHITDI